MSIDLEHELSAGLREHAARTRLGPHVLTGASRRYRRNRTIRQSAFATGVLGLAGSLAAALALAGGNPAGNPGTGGDPAPAQPAGVRLAAAAQATGQTSYRFTLSYTVGAPEGRPDLKSRTEEYTGAFDPANGRGYLTGLDGRLQVRVVDREYYLLRDGWRKMDGPLSQVLGIVGSRGSAGADALTADPGELLAVLRERGTVREASPGVYAFDYPVPGDESVGAHTVSGRVEVDPASNLITRVTQETTLRGAQPEIADRGAIPFRTVLTLSDHGVPVIVERPA